MTLRLNQMYKTATGFIIPRSHFGSDLTDDKSEKMTKNYAVFDVLKGGENHYIKKYTTFNRKELRKVLGLGKGEKVEII